MVKLSDVAEQAGVSSATVSLVFNERPGVNAETREHVLAVAAKLGYVPNNVARNLAMKRSRTVGLVVTDIENPFFGSLTRYIDNYATKQGYTLILAVSNDEPREEDRIIGNFIGDRVAGVIVVPCQLHRTEFKIYDTLRKRGIPFVFSTTFYPGLPGDCVMTDLGLGSYRLTKYLLDLGHREIAHLVSTDREAPICKFRIAGYAKAFQEKGLEFDPSLIVACDKPDFHSGYLAARRLFGNRKPGALIAINDVLALGAKKAIREQGWSIPGDMSVAGYDDLIYSSIADIPLTSVRQNIEEIARLSMKMLVERIEGSAVDREPVLVMPDLMVRESTGVG
jgi:DNA-binding LacI/PurR family transcriptional regulator